MGAANPSANKVYGVFEGEAKPGETAVLKSVVPEYDVTHTKTILEELR